MIKDIYDDRQRISQGFFHYSFWIIGLVMSIIPPIVMSFMKEYYYLPKETAQLGFICMGLGLGIVLYRIGVIAINDITNSKTTPSKKNVNMTKITEKVLDRIIQDGEEDFKTSMI